MSESGHRVTVLSGLSTFYFGLVILIGSLSAGYVVATDGGLINLVASFWPSPGEGDLYQRIGEASRGTVLGSRSFYFLLALGLVAELTHIPLPKGGRMTAGFLIAFAALLMLGLPAALMVVTFVAFVTGLYPPRRSPSLAFFNVGQLSLAYIAANYALTYGHVYIIGYPARDDNPYVALATVAYLMTNFLIVDGYLALRKGISPWRILWEDDRTEIFVTIALAPMALLMAYMHKDQEFLGATMVLIPVFATAYGARLFIQVKRSEQELAAYNQQLTILQQVATRISSQIDLDQTLGLISQEIRRVVAYDDCMIFLLDEKSGMLVRQSTSLALVATVPLKLPLEHGVIGQVAKDRRAIMKGDLALESLDVGVLSGYKSLLAVPVMTEQTVLGVLSLLHRDATAFEAGDERLLKILASQAAVAIQNAQLYRATQQLAVTDGLTKVYNRRYFEDQLTAELARGKRHDHVTSLILLDVDHFKRFNDTHGHLLGDHVLQGVARVLQKSTRETDMVARYGGEEFAVILPETPPEAALEVAERIRRNVKAHPFWGRGQTPLQVTISIGLATDPHSGLEPKPLIDQADISLYQAKKQGRDRVCRTIYNPDAPMEITESRQEMAPEPTLRRPTRSVASLSSEDWQRYLQGNLDGTFDQWWEDPRVGEVLGNAWPFWHDLATSFVAILIQKLPSTEEERNTWLERFQRMPHYRPIQAELARLIQSGLTITQMEYAILAFYKRMQALIQGAPFSLEERITVGSIQERLFHVMQLMIAQVWHDFYQATSEHLFLVSELEGRLTADFNQEAVLEEIACLTARAMGGDACLVLVPGDDENTLVVRAAWGLVGIDDSWFVRKDASLAGQCFERREVINAGNLDEEPLVDRAFLEKVRAIRPICAALMVPLVCQDVTLGVLFCLSARNDHFSPIDVRLGKGIGNRLATALARQRQEAERQARFLDSITALAEAMENRSDKTKGTGNLMTYATGLAKSMGLAPHQVDLLEQASRLHDIGELAIPDAVLAKPSALDPTEAALVRNHPILGARILGYVEALRDILPIVRHHHERVDGSGYPDGLRGQEIPLLARILSVADAFDAMTTTRPYREAMTTHQAFDELRLSQQFDANIIDQLECLVTRDEPTNPSMA